MTFSKTMAWLMSSFKRNREVRQFDEDAIGRFESEGGGVLPAPDLPTVEINGALIRVESSRIETVRRSA
mgnify:FL=1